MAVNHIPKSTTWNRNNPEYRANWIKTHPRNVKVHKKVWYEGYKLRALQIISGLQTPECNNCGCANIIILEVNHKNGGGRRENKRGLALYREIIAGRRKTKDLNVLCRVCNAKDDVERRFGLQFDVKFLGFNPLKQIIGSVRESQ